MRIGTWFACSIPELRRLTGAQLTKVWGACSPFSRNAIYVHLILLLAACSLIFNLFLRLRGPLYLDLIGLTLGSIVPANLYFHAVFKSRRDVIRKFIEDHRDEFTP